jgi:hypothetical protein
MLHMPNVSRQLLNGGSFVPKNTLEWPGFFQMLRARWGLSGFSLAWNQIMADFVVEARRRLFSVVVWTVNEVHSNHAATFLAHLLSLTCASHNNNRVLIWRQWSIGVWMVLSLIIRF